MIDRWYRLVLSGLVILLLVIAWNQGRSDPPHKVGERAAFFYAGSNTVCIRIAGRVPQPGIYELPSGTTVRGAIILTVPGWPAVSSREVAASPVLKGGEVVTVADKTMHGTSVVVSCMHARERMLLGIRLNPNVMDQNDWEALPGIGPALADRIVMYRQNNGDFSSLDGVKSVTGIGTKTVDGIRRYF